MDQRRLQYHPSHLKCPHPMVRIEIAIDFDQESNAGPRHHKLLCWSFSPVAKNCSKTWPAPWKRKSPNGTMFWMRPTPSQELRVISLLHPLLIPVASRVKHYDHWPELVHKRDGNSRASVLSAALETFRPGATPTRCQCSWGTLCPHTSKPTSEETHASHPFWPFLRGGSQ